MSLESDIARRFEENEWTWKKKNSDEVFIPDEHDIAAALDTAAQELYDEPPGSELHVGRLIVVKRFRGHDVYVFAGEYL